MRFDIKGVLTWALRERLKTTNIYQTEIGSLQAGDLTWYLDNYTARAVPSACAYVQIDRASDGITQKLARRLIDDETPLTDTGTRKNNGKHLVCVFRTPDGAEVGVRDDHAKLIPRGGSLHALEASPAENLLVVRDEDTPVAIFPPVKIPEDPA